MKSNASEVAWGRGDLEARLCRALDISKRAVTFFAADGYKDAESPENSFQSEKVIAETAMLIYAASGAGRLPDVASRIDEIARLLASYARSDKTLLSMALHPALCLHFAVPHILLSKLGYRDPGVDDFIRSCLNSQARYGRELPPFGSLEKRWIESLWTDTRPRRVWRADLFNSVLNRPLDILGGLRDDVYAFTHLLMYCTDFGFRSGLYPRGRPVILGEASSLLAKHLDVEDYDLACEILMAWPLTGASWGASATFAFRVLTRIEDQIGVLPSGITQAGRLDKLEGREKIKYALGTAYHTALVMGLLCAVSLRPERAPSMRIAGPHYEQSLLDRLLSLLNQDQGHWHPELLKLEESERNALGPLLLDIAISQKCRKHDYSTVSELLMTASKYGLARSPLCGQAAELLERFGAYSHAIHSRDRIRSNKTNSSEAA